MPGPAPVFLTSMVYVTVSPGLAVIVVVLPLTFFTTEKLGSAFTQTVAVLVPPAVNVAVLVTAYCCGPEVLHGLGPAVPVNVDGTVAVYFTCWEVPGSTWPEVHWTPLVVVQVQPELFSVMVMLP